jgi:hypothetical protein
MQEENIIFHDSKFTGKNEQESLQEEQELEAYR